MNQQCHYSFQPPVAALSTPLWHFTEQMKVNNAKGIFTIGKIFLPALSPAITISIKMYFVFLLSPLLWDLGKLQSMHIRIKHCSTKNFPWIISKARPFTAAFILKELMTGCDYIQSLESKGWQGIYLGLYENTSFLFILLWSNKLSKINYTACVEHNKRVCPPEVETFKEIKNPEKSHVSKIVLSLYHHFGRNSLLFLVSSGELPLIIKRKSF